MLLEEHSCIAWKKNDQHILQDFSFCVAQKKVNDDIYILTACYSFKVSKDQAQKKEINTIFILKKNIYTFIR